MSAREKATSRKGQKRRPKIKASAVLEALYALVTELHRAATIREVAARAGVSRNAASDRLTEILAGYPVLVVRSDLRPWKFDVTANGESAVFLVRRKRELLESEVDIETQGERFDRAADLLEREAAAIEAKLAGSPAVGPRQIALPTASEVYGIMSRTTIEQDAWERRDEQARFENATGGAA